MSPLREEEDTSLDALLKPLDGEAGPARRISRQKSAALVMAALDAGAREAQSRSLARRRRPPLWLMTGAVLFAGAAAASLWKLARTEEPQVTAPAAPAASASEVTATGTPARAVEAEPPVSAPSVAAMTAPPSQVKPPSSPGLRKSRPAEPGDTPAAAPEDLLRKANELRAAGRWKEAEALYLRVIRAQPASLAAYVARVASGSLRLEHLGDARGALRQFEEALRLQPQGVLSQEARHGVAEAWRALGDRAAESRALEDFLSRHPDSPLGASARARLRELSAP
jgi:tetratricopeptide (TPR) repeat protein